LIRSPRLRRAGAGGNEMARPHSRRTAWRPAGWSAGTVRVNDFAGGGVPPEGRVRGKRRARRRRGALRKVAAAPASPDSHRNHGSADKPSDSARMPDAAGRAVAHPAAKAGRRHRRRRKGSGAFAQGGPARSASSGVVQPAAATTPARTGGEGVARRPHRSGAFAALDLGTNNCRLLIAVPDGSERIRVVGSFSRIVRLGEGLAASGTLSAAAMERALDALKICAERIARHEISARRLIATEACRRAANGAAFLDRVRRETGLDLEIVDRQTEAMLAAEGCGGLIDRHARASVLFDIGGGSTELVLIDRSRPGRAIGDHVVAWTSLPVGVVTLSERHGGESVTTKVYEAMVAETLGHIAGFEGRHAFAPAWRAGPGHLLGTSGTVTTIAGLHLRLPRYDRRAVDGIWLSSRQTDAAIESIRAMDMETRAANACIGRERADLVIAGCAVLDAIRRTWPCDRLRVADRGLREGMLLRMMRQAGAFRSRPRRGGGVQ